jgi:hypothetical protein
MAITGDYRKGGSSRITGKVEAVEKQL